MKIQDSAFSSVKATNLPSSIVSYLHNSATEYEEITVKGGLLKDIKYGWLASENKFTVINLKTNQKIAAWNFGIDLKEYKSRITSVCELSTCLTPNSKQLLIGLECDIIGGMVCLFHCDGSRVLRAIQTDCKVTSLTALDDLPNGPLSCFDGVVLVGTQDGALFAFDLNRQSCFEAISHAMFGNESLIRNELNIARLAVLSLDNISLIEEQRVIACNRDDHIAVQLNEGCFHGKSFNLYNPDGTVGFRASRDEVFVSHLVYVPQLASLIVGFNCGAFQIWNLLTTELEFTSQVSEDQLPITHVAFQEPSDDPCAFCYIWIVFSVTDKLYDEGYPIAALYSLRYQSKKTINNTQCLYQDFSNCTLRFQIELAYSTNLATPTSGLIGGRCIACHSISKIVNNKSDDAEDTVINICQISWECWQINQQVPLASYMILFDLDQWYKEHMPYSAKVETNSYLSFVNLTQCIANNTQSHFCDVKVDISSLSQYISVQRLEEHFYPNSYAYDCTCLVSTESVWLSTLGVQRQLLSTLNSLGPSVLLNPSWIYKQCIDVGLTPIYFDIPPGVAPLSVQRALVLSVALAGRLWRLLLRCARESPITAPSSDDETDPSAPRLPPLADWAWTRASTLRAVAHNLSRSLWVPNENKTVNSIKSGPDRNSLRLLRECTAQLASLDSLFGAVVENTLERVGANLVYDISQRKNAVHMVSLYFRVVQWFVDVGLLPEYHLNEESILDLLDDNVQRLPYPVESLVRSYQSRRCQLFRLQGESASAAEMQTKSCPLLFIDQFINIECAGVKLKSIWKEDGSTTDGLYPPPSLHSLLKVYLQPDILEDNKHSLILYALEDYAMIFGDRYSNAIRRLMQFPTLMEMSNTNIKITQAFWHLDHKCFDFALEQLWGVCNGCSGGQRWSWVRSAVVASLTAQRRAQAALQWLAGTGNWNSHIEDTAGDMDDDSYVEIEGNCKDKSVTVGSLYLARHLPEAAIETLRNSNPKKQDYFCFFDECKQMGLLSKISKILLTKFEEDLFVQYLQRINDPQIKGILVMFYLQRARYAEALNMKYGDKERNSEIWSLLVQMYSSGIPTLTTLTSVAPSQKRDLETVPVKVSEPTPMSVFVEPKTPKPITYKSTIIQSAITRASETWVEKPAVLRGLKRTLEAEDTPFICTPKSRKVRSAIPEEDVEKRLHDWDGSTPPKRPKITHDSPTVQSESQSKYNDPVLERDLKQMLHSPAVERSQRSTPSRPFSPDYLSTREATPQSILKVRKLLERRSPSDPRYYAETDEELETASQNTQQSDGMSRSIRFTIPYSDESRESTPPSLSDALFAEELKTPTLSVHSQIETAINYDLPRKKLLTTAERESNSDNNRSKRNISDQSSNSENDRSLYSPNESIADILPEIYRSSGRITAEVSILRDENTITVEPCEEETFVQESTSPLSKSAGDVKVSNASSDEDISVLVPKPRRGIRPKTPESTEVPLRRSTRSRSKTPEPNPTTSPLSPRSKSSIVKTSKARKSLSRQVLEANTFIRKESSTITDSEITNRKDTNESMIKDSDRVVGPTGSTASIRLNVSEYADAMSSVSDSSQLDVSNSSITRLHLPEFNDSILSNISSDSSPRNVFKSVDIPPLTNVGQSGLSSIPIDTPIKGESSNAFDTPIKRLSLPDWPESILSSDTSDIGENVSRNSETRLDFCVNRSPITKVSLSEYNQSILHSDTSFTAEEESPHRNAETEKEKIAVVQSTENQEHESIVTDISTGNIQCFSTATETEATNKLVTHIEEANKTITNVAGKGCDFSMEVDNKSKNIDPIATEISIISEEIVDMPEVEIVPDFQVPTNVRETVVDEKITNQSQQKEKVIKGGIEENSDSESGKEESLEELDEERAEDEEAGIEEESDQEVDSDSSNDSSELQLNIDTDREASSDENTGDNINKATWVAHRESEVISIESSSESESEEISSDNSTKSSDSPTSEKFEPNDGDASLKTESVASEKSDSNDALTAKAASEKRDSEPAPVVSLNSSTSDDTPMLKKDSSDPFLDSMLDSDADAASRADSTLVELPKFSTLPADFTNYSILTDDDSFVDEKRQFDVNPIGINREAATLDSQNIESPVKVVVTDSEGKSTVEIEKGRSNINFLDNEDVEKTKTDDELSSSGAAFSKEVPDNSKSEISQKQTDVTSSKDEESEESNKVKVEDASHKEATEFSEIKERRKRTSSERDRVTEGVEIGSSKSSTSSKPLEIEENSRSPGRRKPSSISSERVTRSKVKSDDSVSISSDTSESSLRRPRRSTLLAKVELSVIAEDGPSNLNITEASDISKISEYSTSRRLTRRQHSLIEKSTKSPVTRRIMTRRSSATNTSIVGSDMSGSFDEGRSEASIVQVESIDPISLLDRNTDGTTGNYASNTSLERGRRGPQAFSDIASPINTPAKPVRMTRRSSVDVASLTRNLHSPIDVLHSTMIGEVLSTPGSSGRPRRQSFNKAVEALQQPRRTRRNSADSKLDDLDLMNTSGRSTPSKQKPSVQDLHGISALEPVLEEEVLRTTPRRRTRRAASEVLSDSLRCTETKESSRRTRAGSTPRK